MKKLLLLALVLAIVWKYILPHQSSHPFEPAVQHDLPHAIVHEAQHDFTAPAFECDGRQYCSQMTSRTEAEYFLHHCPNPKMDGDNDGIPCENDSRF